jgi:hypothetical protein
LLVVVVVEALVLEEEMGESQMEEMEFLTTIRIMVLPVGALRNPVEEPQLPALVDALELLQGLKEMVEMGLLVVPGAVEEDITEVHSRRLLIFHNFS